jgi:hypothetical protein
MIVVHFENVSVLYPRVVISLLAKRLENLIFIIPYTSFDAWPRDHYMSLQKFTTCICHALLWFPPQTLLAVLRFAPHAPLAPRGSQAKVPCHSPLIQARHITYSIPNY